MNFNPRTREGCDYRRILRRRRRETISIHAPVKGATLPHSRDRNASGHFNPRTREGCDLRQRYFHEVFAVISIHAPVKGATCLELLRYFVARLISIHAPVKGATPHFQGTPASHVGFQSTHP